jgi:hypothetical protein
MLEALIDGQRDPAQLAKLAKRRLRSKIPALTEALTGRLGAPCLPPGSHAPGPDRQTHRSDRETHQQDRSGDRTLRGFRDLICTIPGISTDVVTAETGAGYCSSYSVRSGPDRRSVLGRAACIQPALWPLPVPEIGEEVTDDQC